MLVNSCTPSVRFTCFHRQVLHYSIYNSYICMPSLSGRYTPCSNQDLVWLWWPRVFTKHFSCWSDDLQNSGSHFPKRLGVRDFLLIPALDRKQNQIHDTSLEKKRKILVSEKKQLETTQFQPKGQINNVGVHIYNKNVSLLQKSPLLQKQYPAMKHSTGMEHPRQQYSC